MRCQAAREALRPSDQAQEKFEDEIEGARVVNWSQKKGLKTWSLQLVSTNGLTKWFNATCLTRWSLQLVSINRLNKWFQTLVSAWLIPLAETRF